MPTLIIEHQGSRVANVMGNAIVGRDAQSDVVINHPTVSRAHLKIEKTPDGFFIEDLGSKNGTRVNGRPLRQRQRLKDGDKLRIGHVRARYYEQDGVGSTIDLNEPDADESSAGVLFTCRCGARLWAAIEAIGGVVECKACGAAVQVPGKSEDVDSGATISGAVFNQGLDAGEEGEKRPLCSICQWQLGAADEVTTCPECGLTFHTDCWNANHGCSAYGCSQVEAHKPKRAANPIEAFAGLAAEAESGPAPSGGVAMLESPLSEPAAGSVAEEEPAPPPYPWGTVLLGGSLIAGMFGLLAFGAPSLIVAGVCAYVLATKALATGQKAAATVSFILALVGTAAGAAISCMWWLSMTIGGFSL